jgi:hypothetical protein
MHTTATQSAQSLGILNDRTTSPWGARLRSILSSRWYRMNKEPKHDSLRRIGDRLLADVGLYREHRIHHPQNRTDQQLVSPVPGALLAMWMPGI